MDKQKNKQKEREWQPEELMENKEEGEEGFFETVAGDTGKLVDDIISLLNPFD